METLPGPAELDALVATASKLPLEPREETQLQRLLADYERGHASELKSLVVALVGATGAGKSTLLNALSGRDIAREGEDRPTSRTAVIYAPEDATLGGLAALGAQVERYPVRAGAPWAGQVFVDCPDLNSVERENREIARAVVEQSDLALVVMHRGSVAEATQLEFLEGFARRRRLIFALNFADELGPDARETLKAQVRRLASERLGVPADEVQVFAVSALAAKRGSDPSGEFPALLEALRELGETAVAERVRRSNAVGALREMQRVLAQARERLERSIDEVAGELAAGIGDARAALVDEFDRRLESAAPHLRNEARREAAARWWGPAALWMRMSLLGTGGLGLAALLARSNPLVSGGVALGTALVGKVQERTLARSAGQRVLEEGGEEISLPARAAVARARTRASQLGLPLDEAAIPSTEEARETLSALRAAAWTHAQGPAVQEVIAAWWKRARFVLLPVVNLPLLALFAHVAFNVVRGYFEGPYVGLDYLLNALALALLLSMAGAWLGALSLAGVVRRIRRRALERFEAGIAQLGRDWAERTRGAWADARAAAKEIESLLQ